MEKYSGLIELDSLIMDNTIHYRDKHEYKTYTSEFKTESLALFSDQGYSTQESALGIFIELK